MNTHKRITIRFTQEAYIALVTLAAEASVKRGRSVSLNERLNELVIEQLQKDNKNEQE